MGVFRIVFIAIPFNYCVEERGAHDTQAVMQQGFRDVGVKFFQTLQYMQGRV